MPLSYFEQTVTRIRPGEVAVRGTTAPDWDNASEAEITGCFVEPSSTSLDQDGRVLGLSEGLTLYAPADADIVAGDRIEFDGQLYTINGDPKHWTSPTGRVSNMQVPLMRWSG